MVDFISSGIRLGQMCDLSRDVVAGLPVISMLGDCEVFIENYRGILEYSSEYLKVSKSEREQSCDIPYESGRNPS